MQGRPRDAGWARRKRNSRSEAYGFFAQKLVLGRERRWRDGDRGMLSCSVEEVTACVLVERVDGRA